MELHHFRCFVMLAQELNFRRAADYLHLSQPQLTRLIAQLEKEIGTPLLYRTTRQVALTSAGEVFLREAQAVLVRIDQAIQTTQKSINPDRLSIAFTEMARHSIVPKILPVFRDRYPNIKLTIIEACTEEQVEALRDAKVDIGFLHPPLRADFLDILPIEQERFVIALPTDHRLATQTEIAIADLASETLILYGRDHGPMLYDFILHLCEQAGFSPHIHHLEPEQTLLSLVTAKMGVCFIPQSMQSAKNPGVVCLPLRGEAPILEHALAWRSGEKEGVIADFMAIALQQLT